jgi:hypothetical protein
MAKKLGLLKGFIQGCVWSGSGDTRVFLPFQDTVLNAEFTYTGELVMAETFSDQGILGASQACLQKEECGFNLSTNDLSWSILQAATLSTSAARTKPILVTESFTASTVDGDPAVSTYTLANTPITTPEAIAEAGLPSSGVAAANIDGVNLEATVAGSVVTLDADVTGDRVTVQYLRAPLTGEEVIYLGSGTRREQVGVYGTFFGCPGSLLIVAPKTAVVPNFSLGVSSGSTAEITLELKVLRENGYFAEITRLKDCEGC